MKTSQELKEAALDIANTAFASPIWDRASGKWFRCLELGTDEVERSDHHYYDLCNLYGIVRAMRAIPELEEYREQLAAATGWLYWLVKRRGVLGYDTLELRSRQDMYSFALVPAALCAGYELLGREALLDMAMKCLDRYREHYPPGQEICVQASNHHILSLLSVYEQTRDISLLDAAVREARFLLDSCRFKEGEARGMFTDFHKSTAFSWHCYGTWALMELNRFAPRDEYVEAARNSLAWWRRVQLEDGGFFFFFDTNKSRWSDTTVYSVHQKGMMLLSAWDINTACSQEFTGMITKGMSLCDRPEWRYESPRGWRCWKRSDKQSTVVYSYELGWEILGHAKGVEHSRKETDTGGQA